MKLVGRVLILGAAAYFLLAFIVLAILRFDNPAHNGPYEDGSVELAARALKGQPVYPSASVEYIPMIYGPALPYLAALNMRFMGENLPAVRLVSILALLALTGLMFPLMRLLLPSASRLTRLQVAVFALGLFLAAQVVSDYWLDLAKVDALFILAIALNMYLLLVILVRQREDVMVLASLVLNTQLMVFSKQSGILFVLTNVILLLIYGRFRAAIFYFMGAGIFMGLIMGLLEVQAGSEFLRYNFVIPGLHPLIQHKKIVPGQITAQSELFRYFWPQLLLLVLLIAGRLARLKPEAASGKFALLKDTIRNVTADRTFFILGSMLFTAFLISLLGRLKLGGYVNSWLYFHFAAVVFIAWFAARFLEEREPVDGWPGKLTPIAAAILILLQFGALRYSLPAAYAENAAAKTNAKAYAKAYCSLGQPVMNLMNSYQGPLFCGTKGSFLWQSAIDIMFHDREFDGLYTTLQASILKREYKNIIFPYAYDENMLGQVKSLLKSQMLMSKKEEEKRNIERLLLTIRIYEIIKSKYRVVKPENFSAAEKRVMETIMKDNPQVILMKPTGK